MRTVSRHGSRRLTRATSVLLADDGLDVLGGRLGLGELAVSALAFELTDQFVDLNGIGLGKREGAPVEALLSVPSLTGRAFHYSAVLGDAIPEAFHAMAEHYWRTGFRDFKVKLSNDSARDRDKMAVFDAWPRESRRLRADANNLWKTSDEAIAGLQGLADRVLGL